MTGSMDVVLVCPGPGGSAQTFCPHRDTSMWWNRRDALVRCIAAALCGRPNLGSDNQTHRYNRSTRIRLVLVFDDDGARIDITHCTTGSSSLGFIPTERNVLTILQQAAAGQDTTHLGLEAVLVQSCSGSSSGSHSSTANHNAKKRFTTKRELLAHLHRTCDADFLRRHHLNSSESALLKKTNMSQLHQIYQIWQKQQQQPVTATQTPRENEALKATLTDLLTPTTARVILLHESANAELPVWSNNFLSDQQKEETPTHVILCLGAVRDMARHETTMVQRLVVQQHQEQRTTCQRVRLGPVPEFTSKILTLVAWHAAYGVWGPALERMDHSSSPPRPVSVPQSTSTLRRDSLSTASCELHVLCYLPNLASTDVTADGDRRTTLLWQLVRCLVVTLWRSKIHASITSSSSSTTTTDAPSSSTSLPLLDNIAHLVFANGVTLSLRSDDFVGPLAVQHQAAPTEHQVLQALVQRLKADTNIGGRTAANNNDDHNPPSALATLVHQIRVDAPMPLRVVVLEPDNDSSVSSKANCCHHKHLDLVQAFYQSTVSEGDGSNDTTNAQTGSCLACVCLMDENHPTSKSLSCVEWEDVLSDSDLIHVSLDSRSVDAVAATITFLQHVAYQRRWPSTLSNSTRAMEEKGDDTDTGGTGTSVITTTNITSVAESKTLHKRKKKRRKKHY